MPNWRIIYIMSIRKIEGQIKMSAFGVRWGLFFPVTRLIIDITHSPCELNELRVGDTILRRGSGGTIAGLIIVVTQSWPGILGKVTVMSSLVTAQLSSSARASSVLD